MHPYVCTPPKKGHLLQGELRRKHQIEMRYLVNQMSQDAKILIVCI